MRTTLAACCLIAVLAPLACAPSVPDVGSLPETWMTQESPELARSATIGFRKVANAAWWGFDETDSTVALQEAIDSGAPTVIVPDMGKPWVVARTIELASFQTVLFERGVVVEAKAGAFRGKGEPLFQAQHKTRLALIGYGATLKMRKADYQKPPYEKAEWRHALSLRGCSHVRVQGLTLRESGGDGIYIGTHPKQPYCRDVHIKDVTCEANHRQGISVITAQGLLIENCRLLATSGTAPQAGIDLEPNHPNERLADVVIRDCIVEGNAGPGIYAYLKHLTSRSAPISIRVEDCVVRGSGSFGIGGGAVTDDGPRGSVRFRNVVVEDVQGPGCYVYDKSADRARFYFIQCTFRNVARRGGSPIVLAPRRPDVTAKHGGIGFYACAIEDDRDRPAVVGGGKAAELGIHEVWGRIKVRNPHGATIDLGPKQTDVRLRIEE